MSAAPQPCSVTTAKELRENAGLPSTVSLRAIAWVVDRTGGDVDLALDALTMIPRPGWVVELIGT